MEVFDRVDFQYILWQSMEFRQFAIYVMDQQDVGKYKPERFNWNVTTGVSKTVDAKAILLQSPIMSTSQHRMWNVNDDDRVNFMFAFEALNAYFPMWQMRTWRAQHPDFIVHGGSDGCFALLSVSSAFLIVGILNAMFYYVSFTLSPTHEERNEGLAEWNRFGIPLVLSLYVLNIMAIVCFFAGLMDLVYAYAPRLSQQIYLREVGFYGISLPLILVPGFGASVLLTWRSWQAGGKTDSTVSSQVSEM